MKTDLFLIFRYWKSHKKAFCQMIVSIIILMVLLVVSILLERTECRRAFEDVLYGKGSASLTYSDLDDTVSETMSEDDRVESIGQIAICGKLGNKNYQYTYGAYLDNAAEELDHLKLYAGHLPTKSGEIAVYDYVLKDLYFATDFDSYLGQNITLEKYNFESQESNLTGEKTGEETFTIVGIIYTDQLREMNEYNTGWYGLSDFSVFSMPTIYLYSDDITSSDFHTYTMVKLKNDDILTTKQDEISSDFFWEYYNEYSANPVNSSGIRSAAETVCNFSVGSENIFTKIYQSDNMKVLNYFSIIAILLSAISLFGILNIVMEKRMKSLQLLRNIGCSKVRIARILSLEWLFLLICGVICGVIFGVGIYEIVLWIQDKFFGLSKLRGYTAEWAILQVTRNPFLTAIVSTVLMFFLGYFIYFIRYRFFRVQKKQNRRKARSFGRIKRILFGIPFSNIMQMLSIALILTTTVMCYSYYTQNGKGNGYFTDEEASGKSYYSYANVSMNEDNVDICLYDTNNGCAGGITVLSDTGLSEEKLNQISQIDGIETVQSFSNNTAFNVYYPTDDLDVPYQIKEYQAEFPENADEFYHSDERNYYLIPMITGNKTAMDHLSDYIIDGTIGNHEDGIVVVLYGDPEYVESPYSVGERVNFISVYAGGATISHDGEAVIDAIAVIPESAEEEDPVTYAGFGENTICFAATQATASYLETNKKNYDYTYITLSDTADLPTITSEIQNYLDSSTGLKMQTLEECDKAFKQSRINRYASTLFIFVILIFMTIIGYYGLISMRRQNASKNIAVLRSLGMTGRSCNFTFLWSNIKNTLIACVFGTLFVYGLRNLISYKYQSALDAFGYPESDLIMASDEVYAKVNNLNSAYLLNYEIQNAPVIKIILLVSAILILMSVMISVLCLNPKNQKSIILQIHDNTKE